MVEANYFPTCPELDFCSSTFDSLACLQAEHVVLPYPSIKPMNNLAEYFSKIMQAQARQAEQKKKEEGPSFELLP
jgi:hypothetical protein